MIKNILFWVILSSFITVGTVHAEKSNTTDIEKCLSENDAEREKLKCVSKVISKQLKKIPKIDVTRKLKDAVRNLGDTLNKPIQVPMGVRKSQDVRQQQYIK